jgi:Flp pilus assembly pilin Flp
MLELAKRFGNDGSGGTSLEYGLIAAGIGVGITMAVVSLGTQLKSTFASATLTSPHASSATSAHPAER